MQLRMRVTLHSLGQSRGIEKGIARADEHRAKVHRRMDDLVDEVGSLQTELSAVKGQGREGGDRI